MYCERGEQRATLEWTSRVNAAVSGKTDKASPTTDIGSDAAKRRQVAALCRKRRGVEVCACRRIVNVDKRGFHPTTAANAPRTSTYTTSHGFRHRCGTSLSHSRTCRKRRHTYAANVTCAALAANAPLSPRSGRHRGMSIKIARGWRLGATSLA